MTTPSGWHDVGRERDSGHDEMQLWVWRWMRRPDNHSPRKFEKDSQRRDADLFLFDGAWPEMEIVVDDRIVAFADVGERWVCRNPFIGKIRYAFVAYEIKPVIYSVGAVLRQCTALARIMSKWRPDRDTHVDPPVRIVPVVQHDDSKVAMLIECYEGRVLTWDGDCPFGVNAPIL